MENDKPNFDIIVKREDFINRILSPISRLASKAVIVLDGKRLFALANLSNESNGQMFMLSDIQMEVPYEGTAEMVLTGVSKMITALRAVGDYQVSLHYDGTGLDYHSKSVSFRVRLSSETIALPFKKDKVLALKPLVGIEIPVCYLKQLSSLLAGFPNLNQTQISISNDNGEDEVVFNSTDRAGVTDENLRFAFNAVLSRDGEIPENFLIYNHIFRSTGLASLGDKVFVSVGNAFAMVKSLNEPTNPVDGGCIRYILPKLKPKS